MSDEAVKQRFCVFCCLLNNNLAATVAFISRISGKYCKARWGDVHENRLSIRKVTCGFEKACSGLWECNEATTFRALEPQEL